MKKIIIILCVILMTGCTFEERDNIIVSNSTLKFVDDSGYILTLYYDEEDLENVEWIIPTSSNEDANKLYDKYKDNTDFSTRIDNNTIVLDYSEKYIDEVFGTVDKSDIESYLKNKGYKLTTEEREK